jgi:hypothetical protein
MSHLVRSKDQSGWKADRDQETGVFTELARGPFCFRWKRWP